MDKLLSRGTAPNTVREYCSLTEGGFFCLQLKTAAKRRWGLGTGPQACLGLESRARCAGFSVTEIGNRKERLRVREAGASAAGRGQRPYASFPDRQPNVTPNREAIQEARIRERSVSDSD